MKVLPGVRLNFSKSGVGASFGVPGARYSISPTGRRTVSGGIPGTGMSWRETVGNSSASSGVSGDTSYAARTAKVKGPGCFSIGLLIIGVLFGLSAVQTKPLDTTLLVLGLLCAGPALFIIGIGSAVKKQQRPVEDDRAHEGASDESSSADVPETLPEIISEQALYGAMWDAYLRAKRREGGGLEFGMPMDPDEVAIYALSGELFDPAKGLNSIEGTVVVTNKRVIFDSVERNHEWVLAKLMKLTITGPGQRVFAVKGRTQNMGLLFADHVNDFDNALGFALHLSNPRFTPQSPEPIMEEYLQKLAARRAELEGGQA